MGLFVTRLDAITSLTLTTKLVANIGLLLRLCVELARETQSPELAARIRHVLATSLIHSGKHSGHQSLWLLDFSHKTINASKLTETPNALREVSKISCRLQTHMMVMYYAQAMCIKCGFSEKCSQGIVYMPVALLNEIRNHSIAQCYGPPHSSIVPTAKPPHPQINAARYTMGQMRRHDYPSGSAARLARGLEKRMLFRVSSAE
jgi:hypothetical protein